MSVCDFLLLVECINIDRRTAHPFIFHHSLTPSIPPPLPLYLCCREPDVGNLVFCGFEDQGKHLLEEG